MGQSGRTIGRIGLVVAGSYFGGPIGAILGTALGSFLFPPEDIETTGPRLQDLQTSLSRYGDPIKIIYGTVNIGGSYTFATDIVEKKKTKTESAKGGQKTKVTTFKYTANFAVDICESPIAFPVTGVLKILANRTPIYDPTNLTGPVIISGFGGFAGVTSDALTPSLFDNGNFRVQLGAEDQVPDAMIESFI